MTCMDPRATMIITLANSRPRKFFCKLLVCRPQPHTVCPDATYAGCRVQTQCNGLACRLPSCNIRRPTVGEGKFFFWQYPARNSEEPH